MMRTQSENAFEKDLPADLSPVLTRATVLFRSKGLLCKQNVMLLNSVSLHRSAPPLSEEAIKKVAEKHGVPTPIVKIDNKVDNFATVLSVEFGNELGELLDTVSSWPH